MQYDSRLIARFLFSAIALSSCHHASSNGSDDGGPTDAGVEVDPAAGTFHVHAGFVRDPDGRAFVMRGVNLAGSHKNTPYFGFHQPADYARLVTDFGFNSIRFLVVWAAIEPTKGTYDDAYLDEVGKRIDWAADAGLTVVVDMHQDLYGEGFNGDGAPKWTCDEARYKAFVPKTPWALSYTDPNMVACYDGFWNSAELKSHYVEAWRRLAKKVAKKSAIIGVDPMNEPFWGSTGSEFEETKLVPLYADVMTAVRAEAPTWIAFAEPSSAHNLGLGTRIESFPFGNVAYSPHSYDASAETGAPFGPSGHDNLIQTIRSFADEAATMGAAIWIGEYGGMVNDTVDVYMDAEYAGAGSIAASQMYWAYDRDDGGYSLLATDGTEKHKITDAVVRPYPDRTAGDPIEWSFDAKTSTFSFSYRPNRAIAKPTEISVPTRTYPKGYVTSCGGCTSNVQTGRLVITTPPPASPSGAGSGDVVRVVLTPKS